MGADHYEYKGEYLNGKKHGKGRDYCNGRLIYEGEYLNGEKNGKGKEYYCNGRLIYEGEYENGKMHGKGKEYYSDGKLKYEGEYENGIKHGKGKEYCNGKLEYEGEYLNGKKWSGYFYNNNGSVEFKLANGKGKGKEYYSDGELKYEGEYLNGEKNGKGKEYYCNGRLIYEGEYLNGEKNGKGKEYYSDGKLEYEGEYENGKMHGKGKEYYSDGKLKYEGEYENGKMHGKGKEYDSNGELRYEGEYINGKINGKDYFISLIKRFQRALAQNFNKKGKKVSFEFDIRGIKKNLNGAALEIFFFDKTKCSEFMDVKLEHIKNALICGSLYLEIKEERIIPKIEKFFSFFFDILKYNFSKSQFPFELQFNYHGHKVLISIVCNEEELNKVLLDLEKNIIEYIKFNLVFKSDINLSEIIDNDIDISKLLTLIFSIKAEANNIKVLLENIFRVLKEVKIGNIKIFHKISGFLDLVNLSLGSKLKIEYDAKALAEQYTNNDGRLIKIVIERYLKIFYMCFGFDILKNINLDDIHIILGDPRYLNYYVISIKIPGLSEFNKYCSSKYRSEISQPCIMQ